MTHDPKAVEAGLRDAANACNNQDALRMRLVIAADTLRDVAEHRAQLLAALKRITPILMCINNHPQIDGLSCDYCEARNIIASIESQMKGEG